MLFCLAHISQYFLKLFIHNQKHIFQQYLISHTKIFLGAFAKLRNATISFVMSARPSVRVGQLGSHWTEFRET
jgi:hypothetical protein